VKGNQTMKNTKFRLREIGTILIVLFLGILLAGTAVSLTFPNIKTDLEKRIAISHLTQVVVPGTKMIHFPEKGPYAVYYEYHSVVNGTHFETDQNAPNLICQLKSHQSGDIIQAVTDVVKTNAYHTQNRERVGYLIMSITLDRPGIYDFACSYQDGSTTPPITVAVGKNFMVEAFSVFTRMGYSIWLGLSILALTVLFAILAVLVYKLRGRESTSMKGLRTIFN
jgi:hypothetical protein